VCWNVKRVDTERETVKLTGHENSITLRHYWFTTSGFVRSRTVIAVGGAASSAGTYSYVCVCRPI
jgi:hypothetical protein